MVKLPLNRKTSRKRRSDFSEKCIFRQKKAHGETDSGLDSEISKNDKTI